MNAPQNFATANASTYWSPPGTAVEIGFDVSSECIQYVCRGYPEELVSIGAIEPDMAPPARRRGIRLDSFGDHFWRQSPAKYGPSACKLKFTRFVMTLERARALPGVPPDLDVELIRRLRESPGLVLKTRSTTWSTRAKYCGRSADLVSAGYVTAEELSMRFSRIYGRETLFSDRDGRIITKLLDGFISSEIEEAEPTVKPELGKPRPTHLRLVWSRPAHEGGAA